MTPSFTTPQAAENPIALYLAQPESAEEAIRSLTQSGQIWARSHRFSGAAGETLIIPGEDGAPAAALFGLGETAQRFALASFAASAPDGDYEIKTPLSGEEAEEAALAWLLASYRFTKYKSAPARKARLIPPAGVDAARMSAIGDAVYLARDLINTPTNDLGPAELEDAARALASRFGAEVSAVVGDDLLAENFPMIHAVGRASVKAPRLIDLSWGDESHPKITLVGKGVCFDSGGLDIKPPAGMRLMKKDMGGAAAALATASMIMAQKLKVRLRVLIPAVENAISGDAFRPGDVLRSRAGLTVEIGNTDAEGRLVLADALSLASEENPELIIDFATLTGAARVALGPDLAPVFTDDEAFATEIARASVVTRDPVWRMPLHNPYDDDLRSPIADMDSAPGGGFAGAITAALFLRRFVKPGVPWAHFDIYGWTPAAKPGRPKGGECCAARALFKLLEDRYG